MEVLIHSIPVYYEEYGTGIPLLMLHGWSLDHHHMLADMEPLFQNRPGWRRIYLDLPGMGQTPGADWITGSDQMLEVITQFLQIVVPEQPFVVAGISYGGYLAQGLVYQQAKLIKGLFLMVPVVEPELTKRRTPPQQVLVEDPEFLAALKPPEKELGNSFVVQSLEGLENFRATVQPFLAAADQTFLSKIRMQYSFSFPVAKLSSPFAEPSLILTGRQDAVCGYEDVWEILVNYPRATFAVLDRAGHGLGIEQKEIFHALGQEWLNRVEEQINRTSTPPPNS